MVSYETQLEIEQAALALVHSSSVAVLTGAGVSAESGVPTFRASDGLWEGHRIEDVATPEGFGRNPGPVWQFYNARRANVATVEPNPAHTFLAQLENLFPNAFTLITQNVDGLHHLAGSKNVLELHGSLRRTRCTVCEEVRDQFLDPLAEMPTCVLCEGLLRPDIVWFGEMLPQEIWRAAVQATTSCEVFLVVGTSAVVHPASGLIRLARGVGAIVVEANLTLTVASDPAEIGIYGPSGQLLPQVMKRLRELKGMT